MIGSNRGEKRLVCNVEWSCLFSGDALAFFRLADSVSVDLSAESIETSEDGGL